MVKGVLLASLVLLAFIASAQQRTIVFKTIPSNAKLLLDGEEIGDAHNRKVTIGFNQRKEIIDHTFIVKAAGYDDVALNFNIEDSYDKKVQIVRMQRSLPTFDFDAPFLIGFDKVVSHIEYATNIGSDTKWKYRYDEEILIGERRIGILDAMQRMKLPLDSDDPELHGLPPRLQVVGYVDALQIRRGTAEDKFEPYSSFYTYTLTMTWQFLDRKTKEVVFDGAAEVDYSFNSPYITDEFYNAIVENFLVLFSLNPSVEKELIAFELEMERAAREEEAAALRREEAIEKARLDSLASAQSSTDISAPLALTPEKDTLPISGRFLLARPLTPESINPEELVQLTKRAIVSIAISGKEELHGGTIISRDGYLVTDYISPDARELIVQFSNAILLPAEIVSSSSEHDLTLLKVDAEGLQALPLIDDRSDLKPNDQVLSWESAALRTLDARPVFGTLIGKSDEQGVRTILSSISAERTSRGAALIDARGRVVGIIKDARKPVAQMGNAVDARYIYHVFGLEYE